MWWRLSVKTSGRGLALIGMVGGCVGLIAALRTNRPEEVPLPLNSGMDLRGFHTAVYDGGRLQMRVSADSLTLSKARLWGPFRSGFAHALVVRNFTVEIFPDSAAARSARSQPLALKQIWTSLTPSVTQLLQPFSLQSGGGVIVSARLSPLQVIEQRPNRTTVLLKSASCRTARGLTGLVCTDGFVRVGGQERPFQEWRSGSETGREGT